jgi:S-DNA-T family DNA segregation ATPase FtsK/SpoIIIE
MELNQEQANIMGRIAVKLGALKITGAFTRVEQGPIVTTYYYKLGMDTPIAKINKAEEDLALACEVPSVLIQRIGGEVAIAIPNKIKEIVAYDACIHHLMQSNFQLPILLGVDTKGRPTIIDLLESPHILMAGSTGGGKSVLLSAIISGLATFRSKDEMKLMLVDTKQLDLTLFESLPHVVEVADDLDKVHALFDRLMLIVAQRAVKMKGVARNIKEYNEIANCNPLPYYVVVIDELADIIMKDRSRAKGTRGYDKFEHKLQNLLQICRASGIHIICATQRPSVEIITGDIKANLATRIALRLPTGHDSKTIIDEYGAEQLLGKGDMLLVTPTSETATRYHGPYVTLETISNVLMNCDQIRDSYRSMKNG